MAVNPMQRKATTSALIAVLITLIITGTIIGLLIMKIGNLNKQMEEKISSIVKVYVLNNDKLDEIYPDYEEKYSLVYKSKILRNGLQNIWREKHRHK